MAKRTLAELLERALEAEDESPDDLVEIRVNRANTGSLSFNDLQEYSGDTGYGAATLPNLYAWTKQRIYFKHVYDGSEGVCSVPRWPDCDNEPRRIG